MIPRILLRGDHEEARLKAQEAIRQLEILRGLMNLSMLKQDVRRVRYIDGSEIVCRSVFGIEDIEIYVPREVIKRETILLQYIYTTISDYVTIWSLETGEVAEDVCNNKGKLITCPCHKDELITWLKGIKDSPTSQVLKDAPEDNRDYLSDNHKDIGNENRVEYYNDLDPSKELYFGVSSPCSWDNLVQNIFEDTCPGIGPRSFCKMRHLIEYNDPKDIYIINCTPELCARSFKCRTWGNIFFAVGSPYAHRNDTVEYLEPYLFRSKDLYLCSYPSPSYLRPEPAPPKMVEYSIPINSEYPEPIKMESSCGIFDCTSSYLEYYNAWPCKLFYQTGHTFSFKTDLGNLIVNYIPTRYLEEEYTDLWEALRKGFDFENNCFLPELPDGVSTYDQYSEWGSDCTSPGTCQVLERNKLDRIDSESNRFGVSWCGSPSPQEKQEWYRVLLRFYIGGFHQHGHSCNTSAGEPGNEFYCEAETIISETLKERFSSVQATIELEHPENHPKEKNIFLYKRPEKYSTLCAFPDRECGYPEDKNCYPFDGTYNIYTLGEAVEKLINNYYEDGSDDQLITYLLTKETTRKIP